MLSPPGQLIRVGMFLSIFPVPPMTSVLFRHHQLISMITFNSMRAVAAENGYMNDDEIESEISAARRERRERQHA